MKSNAKRSLNRVEEINKNFFFFLQKLFSVQLLMKFLLISFKNERFYHFNLEFHRLTSMRKEGKVENNTARRINFYLRHFLRLLERGFKKMTDNKLISRAFVPFLERKSEIVSRSLIEKKKNVERRFLSTLMENLMNVDKNYIKNIQFQS